MLNVKCKILNTNVNGFTLVELLVAVSILVVGVTGMVALISKLVIAGTEIQQQLIAAGLAQEEIEVIHNIRNTNWLEDDAWSEGLEKAGCRPSPLETASCPILATVNYDSASISETSAPDDWEIPWDGSSYRHGAGGRFSRHVEISYVIDAPGPYMEVKSIVEWRGKRFEVQERLYDWQ